MEVAVIVSDDNGDDEEDLGNTVRDDRNDGA